MYLSQLSATLLCRLGRSLMPCTWNSSGHNSEKFVMPNSKFSHFAKNFQVLPYANSTLGAETMVVQGKDILLIWWNRHVSRSTAVQ